MQGVARVLVVDDHAVVRAGLVHLLGKQDGLEVCGEAGTRIDALEQIEVLGPDLVLADISLGEGRNGIDLTKDITSRYGLPVLVVSMHDESLYAERALRAGARGYVPKDAPVEQLLGAIRIVLAGGIYVSQAIQNRLLDLCGPDDSALPASTDHLSDRELEVFEQIGRGRSTREIATQLSISIKTVENHRAHIKSKLGIDSINQLIRHAVSWVISGAAS